MAQKVAAGSALSPGSLVEIVLEACEKGFAVLGVRLAMKGWSHPPHE
ncbi:Hypothetical protein A7982_04622 [Minicystis rosea]|nr:Hypothetical protein A7982_04622 [Minicystis rosea]